MKSRALRKLACPNCDVTEVKTFGGRVIYRLRNPCPAHRSTRP